jgi:hypothetical protein
MADTPQAMYNLDRFHWGMSKTDLMLLMSDSLLVWMAHKNGWRSNAKRMSIDAQQQIPQSTTALG